MENDFQNWAHTKAHERLLKWDSWFSASQLDLRNLQAPWWCWWPIDHTLGNACLEETKTDFSPTLASSLPHTLEDDLSPPPRLVKMGAEPGEGITHTSLDPWWSSQQSPRSPSCRSHLPSQKHPLLNILSFHLGGWERAECFSILVW